MGVHLNVYDIYVFGYDVIVNTGDKKHNQSKFRKDKNHTISI